MAVGVAAVVHIVAIGTVGGGKQVTVFGVVLVQLHGAELCPGKDEEQAHHNGHDGVIVIRNGAQEHGKAVDAGTRRDAGGDRSRPAGYRRNDADGRSGGIDQVGQLCAGHLLPVGHRAHHRAHGQAVEVVVHKDHHAQQQGGKLCARPAVDVGGRPAAKGC